MLQTKLRPHRWSNTLIAVWIIWIKLIGITSSPVERLKREIYPEIKQLEKATAILDNEVCVVGDVAYSSNDDVPSDQSCLRCKCHPPDVTCDEVQCERRAGCRAIHKPNTCCPHYKCDCEYNGRFYSNGERLEMEPGGECRVCYCRGGEVQCAKVTCYIRPDCEGRKVEGKCCPKYDHCPLREPYLERGHFTTIKYSTIEDSTSTSIQSTMMPISNSSMETDFSDLIVQNEIAEVPSCEDVAVPSEIVPQQEVQSLQAPKITIQEIIPEFKEIVITSPPKREIGTTSDVHGQLLVEETFDEHPGKNNGLDLEDSDGESSEIAEIYQQPPVLRIGDKLLFLKQGELVHEKDVSTPKTVITIIGAEGLQRGFEESAEAKDGTNSTNDSPRQPKEATSNLESDLNLAETSSIFSYKDSGTQEVVLAEEVPEANVTVNENMTSADESTSKRIITMVKEIMLDTNNTETTEMFYLPSTEDYNSTTNFTALVDIELPPVDDDFNTTDWIQTKLDDIANVTINSTNTSGTKDDVTKMEDTDNPEYPPIPDIMSPQNVDDVVEDLNGTTTDINNLKILPEVLPMRSNKTGGTNSTKNDWLKVETIYNKDAILPDAILKEMAPSDEETNATDASIFIDNQLKQLTVESTIDTLTGDIESAETSSVNMTVTDDSGEEVTDNTFINMENMDSNEDASTFSEVEVLNTTLNMTHEENDSTTVLPIDVELMPTTIKVIEKRNDNPDDRIFEELSHEINLDSGTVSSNQTTAEVEKEAEVIFKELLEETGTSAVPPQMSGKPQPRDKESAVLQRVSDAIAKFQLRDTKQSLDTSILGILRDFFSSQYRSYNNK